MREMLLVSFGLLLTACVVATVLFLVAAIKSKDPVEFKDRFNFNHFRGRIFYGAAIVGWLAVIGFGVHGIVSLFIPAWLDVYFTFAGVAGLFSFPLITFFERLPRLRHDYEVLSIVSTWERKQLQDLSTPDADDIEKLENEVRDKNTSFLARGVAATKHDFSVALKTRDEKLKAAIYRCIELEREVEQEKKDEARRAAKIRAAEIEDELRIHTLLESRLISLPTIKSIESLDRVKGNAVIDTTLVQSVWKSIKKSFAEPIPMTVEDAKKVADEVREKLKKLDGVQVSDALHVTAVFNGNSRDGFCDLVATDGVNEVPLYRHLSFSESLPGLATALLLAANLPRYWSWGHGCYDRDAELILDIEPLCKVMRNVRSARQTNFEGKWPCPGFRVRRLDEGLEVTCLALRPDVSLIEISIVVKEGRASSLTTHDIFFWGDGVYY